MTSAAELRRDHDVTDVPWIVRGSVLLGLLESVIVLVFSLVNRFLDGPVEVVLLALILIVVDQTSPTTSDSGSANPAMSADGSGGSSITRDPYIDRHTEVVARHNGVLPHLASRR